MVDWVPKILSDQTILRIQHQFQPEKQKTNLYTPSESIKSENQGRRQVFRSKKNVFYFWVLKRCF